MNRDNDLHSYILEALHKDDNTIDVLNDKMYLFQSDHIITYYVALKKGRNGWKIYYVSLEKPSKIEYCNS